MRLDILSGAEFLQKLITFIFNLSDSLFELDVVEGELIDLGVALENFFVDVVQLMAITIKSPTDLSLLILIHLDLFSVGG